MKINLIPSCSEWSDSVDTDNLEDYSDEEAYYDRPPEEEKKEIMGGWGKKLKEHQDKKKETIIENKIQNKIGVIPAIKKKGWRVRQLSWNTKKAITNYNNITLYGRDK